MQRLSTQASLEGRMMERTQGIALVELAIVLLTLAVAAAMSGPRPAF